MTSLTGYREVWVVDFEFLTPPGTRPTPLCLVAFELHSGRTLRLWCDEFGPQPPYAIGRDALFVAYFASAELGCHLALGWDEPVNVLDLYVEFRGETNGLLRQERSLLGALTHFGIDGLAAHEKEEMRNLIMRGGPYTATEKRSVLDYCESDVVATRDLLAAMTARLDLRRALLRGRYMGAVALMEHTGVPIDVTTFNALSENWGRVKEALVARHDTSRVFDGLTFKIDRFSRLLKQLGARWPRLQSGQLNLREETFRSMAHAHPAIGELRELRAALGQLRLTDFPVGPDDRNRCLVSPFASRTGRNQPSSSRFIFAMASWLRYLIRPRPGTAIAYIDWSQQEFGIAAALANDAAMMQAYNTGAPYMAFAIQAGAAPPGATKHTHAKVREQYKVCALAVLYGMGTDALAEKLEVSPAHAKELLLAHKAQYPEYWTWSSCVVDFAKLHGYLSTALGWRLRVTDKTNGRSLQNFPIQANGAEMMRLAATMAKEAGITLCATVHDAFLIEAPLGNIAQEVNRMQEIMKTASSVLLRGFELRSDTVIVRWPDRYPAERGAAMWANVTSILDSLDPPADGAMGAPSAGTRTFLS